MSSIPSNVNFVQVQRRPGFLVPGAIVLGLVFAPTVLALLLTVARAH